MHALFFAVAASDAWWLDFRLWQVTVPAAVAFFGFYFGTRYNHKLTMRRTEAERDEARRALAAELHAELRWVMKTTRHTIRRIAAACPPETADDDLVQIPKWRWQAWRPPPMPILETHIGQLGLLPQDVARCLIRIGGRASWMSNLSTAMIADVKGIRQTFSANAFRELSESHESIVRDLVQLNAPLADLGGIAPHDWAAIEAKLDQEEDLDAEV